jgi:hypothetical protein
MMMSRPVRCRCGAGDGSVVDDVLRLFSEFKGVRRAIKTATLKQELFRCGSQLRYTSPIGVAAVD